MDDSRTVLSVLRTYLTGEHIEILEASDGKSALKLAMFHHPDVIISDVEMPQMNGIDLFRAVRAAPGLKGIRLVLISSKWTRELKLKALEVGVDARLEKPVESERLARMMFNWLR